MPTPEEQARINREATQKKHDDNVAARQAEENRTRQTEQSRSGQKYSFWSGKRK